MLGKCHPGASCFVYYYYKNWPHQCTRKLPSLPLRPSHKDNKHLSSGLEHFFLTRFPFCWGHPRWKFLSQNFTHLSSASFLSSPPRNCSSCYSPTYAISCCLLCLFFELSRPLIPQAEPKSSGLLHVLSWNLLQRFPSSELRFMILSLLLRLQTTWNQYRPMVKTVCSIFKFSHKVTTSATAQMIPNLLYLNLVCPTLI